MISWCCAIDSDPKWNKSFFWLLLLINLPSKRGFHSLSMVVWHATSYTHCRTSANRIAPFEKPKNRSRFVLFTLHMATLENGITCEDCVSDCHCQVSGFQHQIVVPITSIGFGIGRAQVTMDGRSGTMHNGTKVHGEQVVATIRCENQLHCFTWCCTHSALTVWLFSNLDLCHCEEEKGPHCCLSCRLSF